MRILPLLAGLLFLPACILGGGGGGGLIDVETGILRPGFPDIDKDGTLEIAASNKTIIYIVIPAEVACVANDSAVSSVRVTFDVTEGELDVEEQHWTGAAALCDASTENQATWTLPAEDGTYSATITMRVTYAGGEVATESITAELEIGAVAPPPPTV